MSLAIVLLAAGQGTRMNSKLQKILHPVGGEPMVQHLFRAAVEATPEPPVLVVGPGETGVRRLFGDAARYVVQPEQLGTGHAALMAAPLLKGQVDQVLVTYGDMPLLRPATMKRLAAIQSESGGHISMLTVEGDPGSSFGRIRRGHDGRVLEIIEVAQARRRPDVDEILAISEMNAGVYCYDAEWLWSTLPNLPLRQARGGPEYYLTDTVEMAVSQGRDVQAHIVEDPDECLGAGTRQEMIAVERAFRRRANARWLAAGVSLVDPDSTYIDQTVDIGQDTVIWPNSYLQGKTVIGMDCVIGPGTIIRDSQIGDGCRLEMTVIKDAELEPGCIVRPFTLISGDQAAGS